MILIYLTSSLDTSNIINVINDADLYYHYFTENVVTRIIYKIDFNSDWTGTTYYYVWHKKNASTLFFGYNETMKSGRLYAIYPSLSFSDSEPIPNDTYLLVVSLEDGTIIADSQITVELP